MRNQAKRLTFFLLWLAIGISQALSPVWASLRSEDGATLASSAAPGDLAATAISTVIIRPGDGDNTTLQDATISSWAQDANYGNDALVKIRPGDGTDVFDALLRWNLDIIPEGSVIQSAYLQLYCTQGTGSEINMGIYGVLRPWQEASATWKQAYTGVFWNAPGCRTPGIDRAAAPAAVAVLEPATGWRSWDIASLVQGWVDSPETNYGMILVPLQFKPQTEYAFASAEAYFSVRPKLVVEYGPSTGTRTPTATATVTETTTTRTTTPTVSPTGTPVASLTPTLSPTSFAQGSIQGLVYEDWDGNGQFGEAERGLSGVLLVLKDGAGGVVASQHTGNDGNFIFGALPPATYRIEQYDLPGMYSTTPNIIYVPLAAGDLLWISFGDRREGTLTPTVTATGQPSFHYLPLLARNLSHPLVASTPIDASATIIPSRVVH